MSDSDKKENGPVLVPEPEGSPAQDDVQPESQSTLDVARRFLQTDEVRRESREEKVIFLKTKGISETDINALLEEDAKAVASGSSETTDAPQEAVAPTATASQDKDVATSQLPVPEPASATVRDLETPPITQLSHLTLESEPVPDHAPIVTYPEFLTRRERAPPLVTASGFLQTASALAGFATLVYGASQHVLTPMVSSLTDARVELQEQASRGLGSLVSKLEEMVSEIPAATKTATTATAMQQQQQPGDDAASSCGDPTEVFHRDIGVQTATPPLTPAPRQDAADVVAAQALRVSGLAASLREVSMGIAAQSEGYDAIKAALDVFKDDLDHMSRPYPTQFGAGYTLYGSAGRREPDDEVKAVKENIRRVKGVLLSSRSFPVAGR
ncbi:peroxin 14/17 [Gaeumannomyces tritici R3-111a-1]|uniref:Peroxisomal membrane protein PEX14 n=1 Tax=Gaeumannomyces tritici (strain R3-111a-1) TaxID=644352 RepID=J3NSU6_GAET3|nr:peroxin 14/17 [Gaeumannomyces tritici R3-111a-1]EJT79259.1 peroxin 14/17 [Gaeumannomyces tritici R3-111a-1]